MANNYTIFSEMLVLKNQDERNWVQNVLFQLQAMFDEEEGEYPEWMETWKEFGYLGFDTEMQNDGLWIYAEESGNVDLVAEFVRAFLHRFYKDGFWKMTWACTCSKPRLGEFDGGAIFVTADSISWMNSSKWFSQMEKRTKRTEVKT